MSVEFTGGDASSVFKSIGKESFSDSWYEEADEGGSSETNGSTN